MLLRMVGTNGLDHIDYNPSKTLNILNSTNFKMLAIDEVYAAVYPEKGIPTFKDLKFDAALLTYILDHYGPFSVFLKNPGPGSHAVIVVKVYRTGTHLTAAKYIDPMDTRCKTITLGSLNRLILRNLFEQKHSSLYKACQQKIPSTIFYYDKHQQTDQHNQHKIQEYETEPKLSGHRRAGTSYLAALQLKPSLSPRLWQTANHKRTIHTDGSDLKQLRRLVKTRHL